MFSFFKNLIKSREEWLAKTDNIPPVYKYLHGKLVLQGQTPKTSPYK